MITSAEFQSTDVITIDKGSSVNVGIAVEPSNLTDEEASHILPDLGVVEPYSCRACIKASYISYESGVVTVKITNVSIPDDTTINVVLRLRYETHPSNAYIDTSNTKSIMGGVTG